MKIIDISWPISENITGYKDRKEVVYTQLKGFPADGHRLSSISINSHTGTHIDAPSHFLENGQHIESIKLEQLVGDCRVLDVTTCAQAITKADLQSFDIKKDEIVLFKTKNSLLATDARFFASFVYLEASGAEYLANLEIKAVGIDYLGIERNQPALETHKSLLSKRIPIIEGLRLQHVLPGAYFLCCLPLAIHGLEAAPARAILLK